MLRPATSVCQLCPYRASGFPHGPISTAYRHPRPKPPRPRQHGARRYRHRQSATAPDAAAPAGTEPDRSGSKTRLRDRPWRDVCRRRAHATTPPSATSWAASMTPPAPVAGRRNISGKTGFAVVPRAWRLNATLVHRLRGFGPFQRGNVIGRMKAGQRHRFGAWAGAILPRPQPPPRRAPYPSRSRLAEYAAGAPPRS